VAWQSCGTRHGLRCRPRVTASAHGSAAGRADLGMLGFQHALWDASGRTLPRHVAVSAGHQGGEVEPDGMLAGATPCRHPVMCGS
jgi:hypothetical protein